MLFIFLFIFFFLSESDGQPQLRNKGQTGRSWDGFREGTSSNNGPGEGYKWVWDSTDNRWKIGADYTCHGQRVDFLNQQPRFFCDCGVWGKFYMVDDCVPDIPYHLPKAPYPGKR